MLAVTALFNKDKEPAPAKLGLDPSRALSEEERRAVAEKRSGWQRELSGKKEVFSMDRSQRDLSEEEKKRVAALREVWQQDSSGGGPRAEKLSPSHLTEEEMQRIAKIRADWESSEPWQQICAVSPPDRALTAEETERIAALRYIATVMLPSYVAPCQLCV